MAPTPTQPNQALLNNLINQNLAMVLKNMGGNPNLGATGLSGLPGMGAMGNIGTMGMGGMGNVGTMGSMGGMGGGMGGGMTGGMAGGMAGGIGGGMGGAGMGGMGNVAPSGRMGGPSDRQDPQSRATRTVFVGNLSDDVSDDTMFDVFAGCGDIESIRWLNDK